MLTEPVSPESFEPLEFWVEHKTKILIYAAILVIVLGGYGIFELVQARRTAQAENLFATATSAADFRNITERFPGSTIAGNAALELAEKLRDAKQYDEAIKVLTDFRTVYADHPLLSGAWMSLVSVYELQGKLDEALDTCQQVITKFPNAYTTPMAMMTEGRLYVAKGKKDDARRAYQDVVSHFQGTVFAQQSMRELQFLGSR